MQTSKKYPFFFQLEITEFIKKSSQNSDTFVYNINVAGINPNDRILKVEME